MLPILFNLGPLPIHTYGFLIAVGFILGTQVVKYLARQSKINVDQAVDLTFWLLMTGFIGARILFIITRFSYFLENPLDIFKIWEGGLVFFGGLIAATAYALYFFFKHRLSPWKMIDILSPGLVLAHAFGRLGCLAAGCCYGKPTESIFGLRFFSDLVDPQLRGIPLHPTQLYESVALFILFFGLLILFKRKRFDGQVGLSYFMLYPVIRSIVEEFRGDSIRGFVIEGILSTSQFISALVFIGAGLVLFARLKRTHAPR